jgi:hypothetical protein
MAVDGVGFANLDTTLCLCDGFGPDCRIDRARRISTGCRTCLSDSPTIGAIYGRFGFRILLVYMSTIVLGSCFFAVVFDWTLTAKVGEVHSHHDHHHNAWWQIGSAVLILSLMALFAIQSAQSRLSKTI